MPKVRETAELRFSEAVPNKRRVKRASPTNRKRAITYRHEIVDPELRARADAALRPNERWAWSSATEARSVYLNTD